MSFREALRNAVLALALLAPALGPATVRAEAPPAEVDGAVLSMLVRTTVVALDQANQTGNYTVLRDLGGTHFQSAFTSAALAEMFRDFRTLNVSLAPAVIFDPRLDAPPRLTTDGLLRVLGHFPTRPQQIVFDVTYRYEAGRWRLEGLDVALRAITASADTVAAPAEVIAPVPQPRPAHLRS